LINNRAFQGSTEHPASLNAWSAVGAVTLALDNTGSLSSALRNSVKVTEKSGASGTVGIQNSGYWGFDVKPQAYQGSFYVKGAYTGSFTATLKSTTGTVWATATITGGSTAGKWTKYTYKLVPANAAPNAKNVFTLTYNAAQATTPMNFNLIQLFPPTWNNRYV
jgi:alpha-L-arabinofuranosidase